MSNSYFKFKQFTVEQGKCAMKVSTDACIQGAWTPIESRVNSVLDIGAGTGLLSLMLAQRNANISIDAVELDVDAISQAQENISNSPWNDRVQVRHADVKEYNVDKHYDMIICNPPFFQNSLQGDKANRNMARHNDSLSYKDLLTSIDRLLHKDGYASIMLPVSEFKIWEDLLLESGWFVAYKLLVKPRQELKHNRVIGICQKRHPLNTHEEELCIYTDNGYTDKFSLLMAPFYLKL